MGDQKKGTESAYGKISEEDAGATARCTGKRETENENVLGQKRQRGDGLCAHYRQFPSEVTRV